MTEYLDGLLDFLVAQEQEATEAARRIREAINLIFPERRGVVEPLEEDPAIPAMQQTLVEIERTREALKRAMVVKIPPVLAAPPIAARTAAVDDVLALVATGVSTIQELAEYLQTGRGTVLNRLLELEREGLVDVYRNQREDGFRTVYKPTFKAQALNWIENRARDLGRKVS